MNKKLRKSLTAIICDIVECTEPLDCDMAKTCLYVNDGLPQLEQAFRDAKWIEPQQPEGELVGCPLKAQNHCKTIDDCPRCGAKKYAKVQLAHDNIKIKQLEAEIAGLNKFITERSHD